MAEPPTLVAAKQLQEEFQDLSTIELNTDEFTLGRSKENSAVIGFISLSRKHCVFRRRDNNFWTIEDMSAFGICVNDKKLTKGTEHVLSDRDILKLDPTGEFIYKFVVNSNKEKHHLRKKQKLENEDCDDNVLHDAEQLFRESQVFEVEHMERKIKKAQQLHNNSIMMKRQMEAELNEKMQALNGRFEVQIESLKGEKQEVERQKAELEKERDSKLQDMKQEMDDKITELMDQISRHTETEKSLLEENNTLKERLEREREQFLVEMREAARTDELLRQLQDKCRRQEELRLQEQRLLEETLRRESEQQRIAEQQILARAEAERKLREAHENTEKSLETLKKQVAEKEIEMNMLAEQKLQEEAFKSHQKMSILQEELDKVRTELECEKIVRLFAAETNIPNMLGAGESACAGAREVEEELGPAVRTQFGEILESELQCTICTDLLIAAVTLSCSHTFCKYCITQWKKTKLDCPICRTRILSECRSLVIDSLIEKMVENLSEDMKQKRLQILKDREELEAKTSKKGVAGPSRGGASVHSSSSSTDSEGTGQSDASSERRESEPEEDWDSDDDNLRDPFDASPYNIHSFYRPEYFDYDDGSGFDIDTTDDEQPPGTHSAAAGTGADAAANTSGGPEGSGAMGRGADADASANTSGGPGGSGAVGRGAGAAGARRGRATRDHTAPRSRSRQTIAGVPGSYYGGYGRCYNCGARGHWAPGCPFNQ